jgi:uncharacterized membrane protein (UPF0136 family)
LNQRKALGSGLRYNGSYLFFAITVAAHIIWFAIACACKKIYMGDSMEYIYEAVNIKNGFFYSGNPAMNIIPEYMTQRQPLYPIFLYLIYCFIGNNWFALILQNIISIINILYIRRVFVKFGNSAPFEILFLLMTLLYPAQFVNSNTIAPEILLQFFTALYIGNMAEWINTRKPKSISCAPVFLIGGLLTKPVLYPFILIHALFSCYLMWHQKKVIWYNILSILLPIIIVIAYNSCNYERTGKFHFSSNQAFNAIYFYYPFVRSEFGIDSANRFISAERKIYDSYPVYRDRYNYANHRGVVLLSQNARPYLWYHLWNSIRIFIEPGKAELDLFTGKLTYRTLYSKQSGGSFAMAKRNGWGGIVRYLNENPSVFIVFLVFLGNLFRTIGLLLFFKMKNIQGPIKIFFGAILLYFAVAAGPIANTRYFLPVFLIAVGCSCVGYSNFFTKRKTPSIIDA